MGIMVKFTTSCHAGGQNQIIYLLKPDSLDMIFFALISETYAENILDTTHMWGTTSFHLCLHILILQCKMKHMTIKL